MSTNALITTGIPSTLPKGAPPVRHFLQFSDFTTDEHMYLMERAAFIKKKFQGVRETPFSGGPHAGHDFRESLHPHPREL